MSMVFVQEAGPAFDLVIKEDLTNLLQELQGHLVPTADPWTG
jgi:hypothetical protein